MITKLVLGDLWPTEGNEYLNPVDAKTNEELPVDAILIPVPTFQHIPCCNIRDQMSFTHHKKWGESFVRSWQGKLWHRCVDGVSQKSRSSAGVIGFIDLALDSIFRPKDPLLFEKNNAIIVVGLGVVRRWAPCPYCYGTGKVRYEETIEHHAGRFFRSEIKTKKCIDCKLFKGEELSVVEGWRVPPDDQDVSDALDAAHNLCKQHSLTNVMMWDPRVWWIIDYRNGNRLVFKWERKKRDLKVWNKSMDCRLLLGRGVLDRSWSLGEETQKE